MIYIRKLLDIQLNHYKAHYKEYQGYHFVLVLNTILSSMKSSSRNKLWLLFLSSSKCETPQTLLGGRKMFHRYTEQTKPKIMTQENHVSCRMSDASCQLCLDCWC